MADQIHLWTGRYRQVGSEQCERQSVQRFELPEPLSGKVDANDIRCVGSRV